MIQPKEITIKTQSGDHKTFIISKLPATVGREIFCKYPLSAVPKLGEYKTNEETMEKMMSYVAALASDGGQVPLRTKSLIDNHVPDWETLVRLEYAMLEYNGSFFANGKVSGFLDLVADKLPLWSTKILTTLSAQSSAQAKPPSTN